AMINQGVTAALAARDAIRSTNGEDSHNSRTELKKKMTDKYCPRTKIKKLEVKLWDLKVKESDKIERYVRGLPDMIHGSVVASKPKTIKQDDNQQQQNKRQNRDWSPANTNASNNQRGTGAGQKPTCYECGNQGHYKSDCPKLKNQNHENQDEGTKARGMVYALGGGETDQDPNNIEDEIEA
ncbi:reverse transcriptase domain-containing protein, partial [Tanacetum coccineum]